MEHFTKNGRPGKTPMLILGAATAGILALGGCGQGEDSGAQDSGAAGPSSSASSGAQASAPGASSQASGSAAGDPVFAALDAVMAEHSGATVIAVSQEGSGVYEFDLVEGETVLELEASAGGDVRETGSDQDAEDVADAREAQVTVEEAIATALDGRADRMIDEAELDHHGGQLVWEIDLDDAQGAEAEQVNIDAASGDVVDG
jgi:uncharacterized membrane protein YkoI